MTPKGNNSQPLSSKDSGPLKHRRLRVCQELAMQSSPKTPVSSGGDMRFTPVKTSHHVNPRDVLRKDGSSRPPLPDATGDHAPRFHGNQNIQKKAKTVAVGSQETPASSRREQVARFRRSPEARSEATASHNCPDILDTI